MSSTYAWIIDRDHLAEEFGDEHDDKGVIGPSDAAGYFHLASHDEKKAELAANYQHHHQFRMYDDDGELYYTGTLYWNGDADQLDEEQAFGPLDDFGTPNAGAVLIKYTGKPQWDCG